MCREAVIQDIYLLPPLAVVGITVDSWALPVQCLQGSGNSVHTTWYTHCVVHRWRIVLTRGLQIA